MTKLDDAITKLENLHATIGEELAVARAERDAAATNKGGNGADKDVVPKGDNPFFKLRNPDTGAIDKNVEAKIGVMIAAMGHKAVAEIARAAKSPAAPLGLSLTGLPLRP